MGTGEEGSYTVRERWSRSGGDAKRKSARRKNCVLMYIGLDSIYYIGKLSIVMYC